MKKNKKLKTKQKKKKTPIVTNEDVYKVKNNVHYNFVSDNEVFAEIFNIAMGFDFVDPSKLMECDSREVAVVIDEEMTGETEAEKREMEAVVKLSKELFRDVKKYGVTKTDGKSIFLCIENQSKYADDILERVNAYNSLSYLKAKKKKNGKRTPIITCIAGWGSMPRLCGDVYVFDDYDVDPGSQAMDYLPRYKIPVILFGSLDDDIVEKGSNELKAAEYAVRIAIGKMDMEEVMKYNEKVDELFKVVNDPARDLMLAVTGTHVTKEEVLENGWNKVWGYYREEGREAGRIEGEKKGREAGRIEGEKKGRLEGILDSIKNLQKNEGWSFDKAAASIGVSDEDRALLKTMC